MVRAAEEAERAMLKPIEDETPPPDVEALNPPSYHVFQTFVRTLHLHRQLVLRILSQEGAHPGQDRLPPRPREARRADSA